MAKSFRGVNGVRFSVIIPVYNAEKYLEECVNSVLCQTYKDFEIVLIDDGSVDKSGDICDRLKNIYGSQIKVIHQENKGQLLSRCAGAENAQGDYCIYVDADDIIYENCLEVLSTAIDRFSNPDIIGYKLEKGSQLGKSVCREIPLVYDIIYYKDTKKYICEKMISTTAFNSMCNKCVKRECLLGCESKFLKYKSLRCAEDRLQSLECITRAETIVFINECLYFYRVNDGSVTNAFDVSQLEKFNMKSVYYAEKTYLKDWGFDILSYRGKLVARWLNETIYTFSRFYENATTTDDRKAIVDFKWDSFLPDDFSADELKYCNPNSVLLYKKIKEKDYAFLRVYFFRKAIYKKYKHFKARLKK